MANTTRRFRGMQWCCLIVLLQFAAVPGSARAQQDQRNLDHAKLQAIVEGFEGAWNRVDVAALAMFFGEQALLITPIYGATDRRSIQHRIAQEHTGRLRGTRLKPDIVAIDFPTDNIAVLQGNYKLSRVRVGLRSTRTLEGPFVFRFQRNGDHWEIVRARLYRVSETNLAFRDAHNERYPFIQSAQAETIDSDFSFGSFSKREVRATTGKLEG